MLLDFLIKLLDRIIASFGVAVIVKQQVDKKTLEEKLEIRDKSNEIKDKNSQLTRDELIAELVRDYTSNPESN